MHLHRGRLAIRAPRPFTVGLVAAAATAGSTLVAGVGTQIYFAGTEDALWKARVGTTMLRCGLVATALALVAPVLVRLGRGRQPDTLRRVGAGLAVAAVLLSAIGVVDYRRSLHAWPGLRRLLVDLDLGPDIALLSRTDEGKPTALGPQLPSVLSVYELPLHLPPELVCERVRSAIAAWADAGTARESDARTCGISALRRGHGVHAFAATPGDTGYPLETGREAGYRYLVRISAR